MKVKKLSIPDTYYISYEMAKKKVGWKDATVDYALIPQEAGFLPTVEFTAYIPFKRTIRGLYYQERPFTQALLVTALKGEALIIAVDIRRSSPSYGKSTYVLLRENQENGILIPRGCALGMISTTDQVMLNFRADNFNRSQYEHVLNIMDPNLEIQVNASHLGLLEDGEEDYVVSLEKLVMSRKAIISVVDRTAPWLHELAAVEKQNAALLAESALKVDEEEPEQGSSAAIEANNAGGSSMTEAVSDE